MGLGSRLADRPGVNETAAARFELPTVLRWTIAIVAPIVAVIANKAIPNGPFPTPFLLSAVMISAHFGGIRAGTFAFVVSFALLVTARSGSAALEHLLVHDNRSVWPAAGHHRAV